MFSDCGYIIFLLLLVPYIESAHRLNEYISHYELLSYDHEEVHKNHLRVRRSVAQPDNAVHLSFQAHGREFRLRLKRDMSTFSDQLEIFGPSGALQVDTAHIYHGRLVGEPDSSVFGSIIDGVFEGKIVSPTGSYYVEKARHYFPPHQNFHSVIYNENHVEDPYQHKRQGHAGGCGFTDDVRQWMNRIKNSAVDTDLPPIPVEKKVLKEKTKPITSQVWQPTTAPPPSSINVHENPHDKYNRKVNKNETSHQKSKRAVRVRNDRSTCSLYIRTDPLIWKHIREGIPEHKDPTKELEVNEKTRQEILSLIAHHVAAINYIYSVTKFGEHSEDRNIKFEVQRIKIDDEWSCRCKFAYNCEVNQFCMENVNVTNFLNMHSLDNHEDFCLAYVFTYRDFTGGILSLAWEASASSASGGICDKYKTYSGTSRGMFQFTKRSLNTGIITFVNYNSRVPPKVSQLILAHAIGHNFGSPHDYPNDCQPGGQNGNFIMFASATSGDRPNNSKFSTCSVRNISSVLDAIEENRKRNCFTASAGSFCGNQIVEAGEECDCGYDMLECSDRCCYPRILDMEDRAMNRSAKGCSRRAHAQCSPSQGPCCSSDTCKFVLERTKGKRESDCSWSSTCNGRSPECPAPKPIPNKTCNNGTQVCINGECSGSICLAWNLTECFLISNIIPDIDKRKLCELACQNGTDPSTCRSTSEFAHRVGLPPGGISLRPGSPCDNYRGYCDIFLKCQAVDADEPYEPAAKQGCM